MAIANISGGIVDLQISTNVTVPDYKTVVCAEGTKLNGSREVNKRKTKCGTIVAIGDEEWTVTGSGAASTSPAAGEMSHVALLAAFQAGADVLVKLTDADAYVRIGQGKITSYNETADDGDSVGFDFQIDIEGAITIS